MRKKLIPVFFISAILLLACVTFLWFKKDHLIYAGDFKPPFRPVNELVNDLYVWDRFVGNGLGIPSKGIAEVFPYELLVAFGSMVGLSLFTLEKIFFYLILSISGLTMFFLVRYAFRSSKTHDLAAFVASLFYMFNTYTLFFKWPNQLQSMFAYIFLPLSLLFYMKGLESRKGLLYAFAGAITFFLVAPSSTTPTYPLLIFIVLFFYFIFHNLLYLYRNKFKHSLLFTFQFILLVVFLNAWLVFPYIHDISREYKDTFKVTSGIKSFGETTEVNSLDTSFFNIFRLMGFWALKDQWQGDPYYPGVFQKYLSVPLELISLTVPLILFISFFMKKIERKIKGLLLFFSFLSLMALFLVKGVHEPFGQFNRWLFFSIPGFSMFRSQYEKFGTVLVFGYSILFGWTISHMYIKVENKGGKIVSIFFLFLVFIIFFIINALPFWTGDIIQGERGILKSKHIKIPEDYFIAGDWLQKEKKSGRIILFPFTPDGSKGTSHFWGYGTDFMLSRIFNYPTMVTLPFGLTDYTYDDLNVLLKVFPLFNISYIVTDSSRDSNSFLYSSLKKIETQTDDHKIKRVKELSYLKFYKIDPSLSVPYIYTPKKIFFSEETSDHLLQVASQLDYGVSSAIYFSKDNSGKEKKEILGEEFAEQAILEYKSVNPTKLRIRVHQAKSVFPLIFSESYDNGWKAYIVNPIRQPADKIQNPKINLENYKPEERNLEDQANKNELEGFLDKGWVSALEGSKNRIDFISKNFQYTIQNNNLPDGFLLETWFRKLLDEKNHLKVNGFANSWIIDPNDLCSQKKNPKTSNLCLKNSDGSYEIELVIEYWPQRLVYGGTAVSILTLIIASVYLIKLKSSRLL